jgi:hypothetical protein
VDEIGITSGSDLPDGAALGRLRVFTWEIAQMMYDTGRGGSIGSR